MDFELSILDWIQKLSTPIGDKIWVVITHSGDLGLIWFVITFGLLLFQKTRKLGIMCFIAILFSVLITNGILKNVFQRARPYHYRDIILLINEPNDFSFPSGHTSISFSVAFVLLKEQFKIRHVPIYAIVFCLAILIAFSRMYIYVHFPSDIIVAVLIGYLCSRISRIIFDKFIEKHKV